MFVRSYDVRVLANAGFEVEWNCNLLVMRFARGSHYEIVQIMRVTQIENAIGMNPNVGQMRYSRT